MVKVDNKESNNKSEFTNNNVIDCLSKVEDPRDPAKVIHPLPTILFISICAIFCGAEGWEDIVSWAESQKKFLSKYVDISKGIPSYSTIRRIFSVINPKNWGEVAKEAIDCHNLDKKSEDHISIDGKTLRGSKCKSKDIRAIQMVSAFSIENNLTLAEVKTDSKSNEIKAIPVLLDLLDIKDATISIDAIACNEKIVSAILDKGANYLLGLKKNQPKLHEAVEKYIQEKASPDNLVKDYFDNSHGRVTRRRYFTFDVNEDIAKLGFTKMNTIIATETISSDKYKKDKNVKTEWRYYISNHKKSNKSIPNYIKDHWQVESNHWLLDVHLKDDHDKKYEKNAAENFAKTKRLLLNLVKSIPPKGKKRSIRSNLKKVGWDLNYLVELLFT